MSASNPSLDLHPRSPTARSASPPRQRRPPASAECTSRQRQVGERHGETLIGPSAATVRAPANRRSHAKPDDDGDETEFVARQPSDPVIEQEAEECSDQAGSRCAGEAPDARPAVHRSLEIVAAESAERALVRQVVGRRDRAVARGADHVLRRLLVIGTLEFADRMRPHLKLSWRAATLRRPGEVREVVGEDVSRACIVRNFGRERP
jgi:hypothetical protein